MCKLMEDMRNEAELESARKTAKRTGKKEVHHKKANKERAGERERQFY